VPFIAQHPGALASAVAAARAIRVYDGGLFNDEPLKPEPLLTIEREHDVAELRALIQVRAITDGRCMCLGDSVIEFLAGGHRMAIVSLHHATALRWSAWDGDAKLTDGRALVDWLAAHGYGAPLERAVTADARRAQAAADQDAWRSAAPASLHALMPALLETSQTGSIGDELIVEVKARLAGSTASDVERCRQLLAWYASGTGRCSGFPVHEDIPARILTGLPISMLLKSLDDEPADSPIWAGALRHLASWRSRTEQELGRVPTGVWDKLVRLAEASGDSDTLRRITANRARVSTG
jgi:hypothetical protein